MPQPMSRADRQYLKLRNRKRADSLCKQLLNICVQDLLAHNIPVQSDRTCGIYLGRLSGTSACCYSYGDADGQQYFRIILSEKFADYCSDPVVVEHVKNSIYHELLHTCPDAMNHGPAWMCWSAVCDAALHTHTRRHMEAPIYYNRLKRQPSVYRCLCCGNEYYATAAFQEQVPCELCGAEMKQSIPNQ